MDLLDPFIPRPDVRERREIVIDAPAVAVFEAACNFDIQSLALVRAIFWLRAKVLGAKIVQRPSRGLIADMLSIGWEQLAEEPGRYFVGGAACRPWNADVTFQPVPAGEFALFAEPDAVKIAWTLEAAPIGPTRTRLSTETRVVATDNAARAKFRWYWRKFGIGIVLIRIVLLRAVRCKMEAGRATK